MLVYIYMCVCPHTLTQSCVCTCHMHACIYWQASTRAERKVVHFCSVWHPHTTQFCEFCTFKKFWQPTRGQRADHHSGWWLLAHACTHMHTCRHSLKHVCVGVHAHTYRDMHTDTHMHACMHSRTHARMHTHTRTHAHIYNIIWTGFHFLLCSAAGTQEITALVRILHMWPFNHLTGSHILSSGISRTVSTVLSKMLATHTGTTSWSSSQWTSAALLSTTSSSRCDLTTCLSAPSVPSSSWWMMSKCLSGFVEIVLCLYVCLSVCVSSAFW